MISRRLSTIPVAVALSLMFALPTYAQIWTGPPSTDVTPEDMQLWQEQAGTWYYRVLPWAIRRRGESEEFLFPAKIVLPVREGDEWPGRIDYVCLARRDKQGKVTLLWYKQLVDEAFDSYWLPSGDDKTDVIVLESAKNSYVYRVDEKGTWKQISSYDNHFCNTRPGSAYIATVGSKSSLHVFYEDFTLCVLDLEHGEYMQLLPQPDYLDTMSMFLGVGDFDGDGKLDIVGETTRVPGEGAHVKPDPTIIHVWNYDGPELREIYAGKPMSHWALQSFLLRTGPKTLPIMAACEIHWPPASGPLFYFHLYSWNGKGIEELGDSKELGTNVDVFVVADLDGDGADEIVAKHLGTHLEVLKWDGKKLVRLWKSPNLTDRFLFGRIADYDGDGRQEVPFILGEETDVLRQVSVFDLRDGKYVGWEKMVYVPPSPRPEEVIPLKERFDCLDTWSLRPEECGTFLVLDGTQIQRLMPAENERPLRYAGPEMARQIIEAAEKKVPVKYIVAQRKTRRVKGKVEEYYEIRSGAGLIMTLTTNHAAAYKTTLKELAGQMKDMVKTVVGALETPKYREE